MLIAGSDDGAYRLAGVSSSGGLTATKVLDSGRVRRVRTVDGIEGVFAATRTGLFHSPDGDEWTDLAVPQERVYAVGTDVTNDRLYAGTRPARVYVADVPGGADGLAADELTAETLDWHDLEGFQDLPSRDEWQRPRHENLAQVWDVHPDPGGEDRLVAGVEVGGVHVSEDGGETWTERRDGVHDDVHELRVVDAGEYVAATGYGLYHTTDGGRTWDRLDGDVTQRYFRTVRTVDGVVYAGAALANSSTWNDDDVDPALFAWRGGDSLETVDLPTDDETVTGLTAVDGDPVAATHRGTLLVRRSDGWTEVGEFPVTGEVTGRYTPLCWVGD